MEQKMGRLYHIPKRDAVMLEEMIISLANIFGWDF